MKIRIFGWVSCVICLFFAFPVFTRDIENRWGVGYRYSYVAADDADYKTNGNSHGLTLTRGISDNFAVELEGGYFKLESKSGSEIEVLSLHTNGQLRLPLEEFIPYLVAGAGFHHYDYGVLRQDDRKDKQCSFSYKFGGGAEYFLDNNLAFNLEAAYVYGNTGGGATLDVYHWRYCAGIKYYF